MVIKKDDPMKGVVTSRRCPTCGHHEVGIISKDNTFHPLRPGTWVQILEGGPPETPRGEGPDLPVGVSPRVSKKESRVRPWVPAPVRGNRSLRQKYGVILPADLSAGRIDGKLFEAAYLEKLRRLIEREVDIPVAVILDQFFTGPHLASGSPKQIALNMWQELEEIRRPVELMKSWLESPNEERFANLIAPVTKDDLEATPISEEEIEKDLDQLSLEEFLGLLCS